MPNPIPPSWPTTPAGATDWEVVFEDAETGLIPLINQARTPGALRDCAVTAVTMLFGRKGDGAEAEKFTVGLAAIIPDGAGPFELDAARAAVAKLLRAVKDERKQKAAAFAAQQAVRRSKERRAEVGAMALDFQAQFEAAQSAKRRRVGAALAVSAVVFIGAGLFAFFGGFNPGRAPADPAAVKWVRAYVTAHLPNKAWMVVSVAPGEKASVVVTVEVMDPDQVAVIKSKPRMARPAYLRALCPPKDSGVWAGADRGKSIWIDLTSTDETLTGGTCRN